MDITPPSYFGTPHSGPTVDCLDRSDARAGGRKGSTMVFLYARVGANGNGHCDRKLNEDDKRPAAVTDNTTPADPTPSGRKGPVGEGGPV